MPRAIIQRVKLPSGAKGLGLCRQAEAERPQPSYSGNIYPVSRKSALGRQVNYKISASVAMMQMFEKYVPRIWLEDVDSSACVKCLLPDMF